MQTTEYFAKVVFLCASALGTTALMLNSTSNRFQNGLGNDSGELGHNLMDHHFRVGASGTWEGDEDTYYYGRRANGIYVPRYRNIGGDKRDYLRGFGYQGGGGRGRGAWASNVSELSFVQISKNKQVVLDHGQWA
jgi:choline dehydrogenase-like flavoprotein